MLLPHLAQHKITFVVDEVELLVGILNGSPGLQKRESRGNFDGTPKRTLTRPK